jgi:cysteinyl-tRNA synthetase
MLTFFNSLTKTKEEFIPKNSQKVTVYTCGPTVYNRAHIGNFFAYVSADTLVRTLQYIENFPVFWVMNITDIDDKTIRDSQKQYPDLSPKEALTLHTEYYETIFKQELESLNIRDISIFPRAKDFITSQQALVQKIWENGYAYISQGSVYFSLSKYKEKGNTYGMLSCLSGIQNNIRIDNDEYEKDEASDFVLWKKTTENEPSWDFVLQDGTKKHSLPGRPGWHLECSAMEHDILSFPFDIHTGGVDLKFPHHENEIAQVKAGYDIFPNHYWFHNGHILVEGKKMSKKYNNFWTLTDILNKGFSSESIRLSLSLCHFQKDAQITENNLQASLKHIEDIRETLSSLTKTKNKDDTLEKFQREFISALQNNLNTPLAFKFFLDAIKYIKKTQELSLSAQEFISLASHIFAIDFFKTPEKTTIPENILLLAEERVQAKEKKDFAKADALREEIQRLGYTLKDTKEGCILRKGESNTLLGRR